MTHTYWMLVYVQALLEIAHPSDKTVPPGTVERLTRIEGYLIRRYNRE